jgi:hypothetical protein
VNCAFKLVLLQIIQKTLFFVHLEHIVQTHYVLPPDYHNKEHYFEGAYDIARLSLQFQTERLHRVYTFVVPHPKLYKVL